MRLLEMTLAAVDLNEMRQFYCALLGIREIEPEWTGRLALHIGTTQLFFEPGEPGWHGRYHFALDVPASRFEAALSWLRERSAPLSDPTGNTRFQSEGWNAEMVYFTDPQGNILELIARRDKPSPPRDAERPFNASEILSISEIGLAVTDVTGSVAELQARMPGLAIYNPVEDDMFAALGDTDGLLIVARRGRIWYPETGVPAYFLPLNVLLEVGPGQRYRLTAPPFPFIVQPAR
jgi:catechol 2,3-dioxygenase-like lactoylglutathione lyase family enzyme